MGKDILATRENEVRTSSQEQSVVAVRSGKDSGRFLRTVGLIIGREYKNKVTQRSFLIGTLITLVLLVLAACVPIRVI